MSKLKTFSKGLRSFNHISGVSNISSSGISERTTHSNNVYYNVYYSDTSCLIYIILNDLKIVDNGELGRSSSTSKSGFLYIAIKEEDKEKALKKLRKGKIPKKTLGGAFFSNFDRHSYYKDNNFPISFFISTDEDNIKSYFENFELDDDEEHIILEIDYFDCFVFDDGLEIDPSEELPTYDFLFLNDFYSFINDKEFRLEYLWEYLDIEKYYNTPDKFGNNILDCLNLDGNKTFRKVIEDSFRNFRLADNDSRDIIKSHIDGINHKYNSFIEASKNFEKRSIESNKRYDARHLGEGVFSNMDINMINRGKSSNILGDNILKLDFLDIIKSNYNIIYRDNKFSIKDYDDAIIFVIDKIVNNSNQVDLSFGYESLKGIMQVSNTNIRMLRGDVKVDKVLMAISKDLKVDFGYFRPILDKSTRTVLQVIESLVNN